MNDVPEQYRFKQMLFASVDIANSTAYKSMCANESKPWAHVFRGFFDEFPALMAKCFADTRTNLVDSRKPERCMDVWKFVGDEILFFAELRNHGDAAYHAQALKNALHGYTDQLRSRHSTLGLKGTIWNAGFPVINVEVDTQVDTNSPPARDFLGPSVDLGFRLAAFADARRIPVSADVALFLISSSRTSSDGIHLLVDPPQYLKGFNTHAPYPLIWIDRCDGKPSAEDKVLGRSRECTENSLRDYLNEFYATSSMPKPFIEGDPGPIFGPVPQIFCERREQLMKDDTDLQLKLADGKNDPSAMATTTNPPLPDLY